MTDMNSKIDTRALLSTAWIFTSLNYLYCDLIGLMDPPLLKQFLAGNVGGLEISPAFLLGASILMEIPISGVFVSRILSRKTNRIFNIIAGSIMTIVQCASLFFGTAPTTYYIFFSVVEVATTVFIVWTAVRWRHAETPTAEPVNQTA